MRKSITRILSLSLAVLMVLSLAACGKKPTTGTTSTPSGTTSTPSGTTSTPSGTTSTPAAPGKEDLRGKINPKQELNADGTKKKLTIGIQQLATVLDYENNAFTKYMEELMNIDIEFVMFASDNATRAQQVNTMLAGSEDLPDILFNCFYSKADQAVLGDDGYLVEMSQYFDDPDSWDLGIEYDLAGYFEEFKASGGAEQFDAAMNKFRTPEGAMYAWPSLGSGGATGKGIDTQYNQMWINKVWLDNLGLQKPTNWDELLTVLRAFKNNDPNKNGKTDEIPMTGFSTHVYGNTFQWVINMFGAKDNFLMNDNVWLGVYDDGTVYNPYMQDAYRDGLRRMNQLYEEGLLDTSAFTMTKNDVKAYITPGSGQALVGLMSCHETAHTDRSSTSVFMEYEALPAFETATVAQAPSSGSRYYFITDSCKDFDLAAEFLLQWMHGAIERYEPEMSAATFYACRYGLEGTDWHMGKDYETGLMRPVTDNKTAYSGGQTNTTWGVAGPVSYIAITNEDGVGIHLYRTATEEADDGEWTMADHVNAERLVLVESYNTVAAKNNPKYTGFNEPSFTAEEVEENDKAKTDTSAYFKEYRVKFVTGELDVDDDKVWAAYIAGFADTGNDTYLKNAQAAFDRVYKNK